MLGGYQLQLLAAIMLDHQLIIMSERLTAKPFIGGSRELDAEAPRRIATSRSWFGAVKNLSLGVKVLEAWTLAKHVCGVSAQLKIDLPGWLVSGLGQLLVGDTFQEGLLNVHGCHLPPSAAGFGHKSSN